MYQLGKLTRVGSGVTFCQFKTIRVIDSVPVLWILVAAVLVLIQRSNLTLHQGKAGSKDRLYFGS